MAASHKPGAESGGRPLLRLPADLLARLDAAATAERRSRDGQAEHALVEYLWAHPGGPPAPPPLAPGGKHVRLRFGPRAIAALDDMTGHDYEARPLHLVAALRWSVERKSTNGRR